MNWPMRILRSISLTTIKLTPSVSQIQNDIWIFCLFGLQAHSISNILLIILTAIPKYYKIICKRIFFTVIGYNIPTMEMLTKKKGHDGWEGPHMASPPLYFFSSVGIWTQVSVCISSNLLIPNFTQNFVLRKHKIIKSVFFYVIWKINNTIKQIGTVFFW
jgi:hypothetical protein